MKIENMLRVKTDEIEIQLRTKDGKVVDGKGHLSGISNVNNPNEFSIKAVFNRITHNEEHLINKSITLQGVLEGFNLAENEGKAEVAALELKPRIIYK